MTQENTTYLTLENNEFLDIGTNMKWEFVLERKDDGNWNLFFCPKSRLNDSHVNISKNQIICAIMDRLSAIFSLDEDNDMDESFFWKTVRKCEPDLRQFRKGNIND